MGCCVTRRAPHEVAATPIYRATADGRRGPGRPGAEGWLRLVRRAARYRELAIYHTLLWAETGRAGETPRSAYHRELSRGYRHAAERPWLPVEPDPPEPE